MGDRLQVWGVRRDPPDWDGFLEGLITWALREVDQKDQYTRLAQVLSAVVDERDRTAHP